jgi:hypothetical protein
MGLASLEHKAGGIRSRDLVLNSQAVICLGNEVLALEKMGTASGAEVTIICLLQMYRILTILAKNHFMSMGAIAFNLANHFRRRQKRLQWRLLRLQHPTNIIYNNFRHIHKTPEHHHRLLIVL